jgi:hypothetical protein
VVGRACAFDPYDVVGAGLAGTVTTPTAVTDVLPGEEGWYVGRTVVSVDIWPGIVVCCNFIGFGLVED